MILEHNALILKNFILKKMTIVDMNLRKIPQSYAMEMKMVLYHFCCSHQIYQMMNVKKDVQKIRNVVYGAIIMAQGF